MINESKLSCWWQSFRGFVRTTKGEALEVVFPGKFRQSGGPDFQGAILRLSGRTVYGDVEVHTRSSLWYKHRHHLDPRFKNVALHLVYQDDIRQEGMPVLAFNENFMGEPSFTPCGTFSLLELDRLGKERFREKKTYFAYRLAHEAPPQVLYEELMGALGYSENKDSFIQLARRLPLSLLMGKDAREIFLKLKEEAGRLRWCYCGVRPTNLPLRRLEGIIYIISRYGERLPLVLEKGVKKGDRKAIEDILRVPGFLGRGRVAEMVINVVLPFFSSLEKAEVIFSSYPKTGENFITRLMKKRLSLDNIFLASEQQGLIYIYKRFCLKGDCFNCPVKRG